MKPDPHSYANSDQVIVTHLDWDATVDFETKRIKARASWSIDKNTIALPK